MTNDKQIGGNREKSVAETYLPLRSNRITHVNELHGQGEGASNITTGEIWVPYHQDELGRVTREHEALHLDHTRVMHAKDMLDQAIEDARIHLYCSGARDIQATYPSARQDEIKSAVDDIAKINSSEPIDALLGLRSVGVLGSDLTPDEYQHMSEHLGKHFVSDCSKALAYLSKDAPSENAWRNVRRVLAKYFDENREPEQPKGRDNPIGDFPVGGGNSGSNPVAQPNEDESEDDSEDDNESETDKPEQLEFVPAKPHKHPKRKKIPPIVPPLRVLVPEKVSDEYEGLSEPDPIMTEKATDHMPFMKVHIVRFDLSTNSVPNTPGCALEPARTGGRIFSTSRLALAKVNPNVRVLARPVGSGGGTILIDASGSMHIPLETLNEFCRSLPAATIAMYNAYRDHVGAIFVFAANGRRALSIPDHPYWGEDNYIDYQAIRWLLKQPAPRYLVTDFRFTGSWNGHAHQLCAKAFQRKLLTPVINLDEMAELLKTAKPTAHQARVDDYDEMTWRAPDGEQVF